MFSVYILKSLKDRRTYVGYSNNLQRRLKEHNSGRVNATKYRYPFSLLLTEEFATTTEAKRREKWWKSGFGRKKLKELYEASE